MSMTAPRHRPRRSRGFSLMEVLVALLVLAIGLLGLAALQAQGLRYNHDAYVRSQATSLAYDIIDRMRANRANATDYAIDLAPLAGEPCDPTLATIEAELTCWLRNVQLALPGGTAAIAVNPDPNYVDVTVSWTDRETRQFDAPPAAPRLPNQAECLDLGGRLWLGGACMVTQTWTVWP
jgi:type IV pilus assembly protein PilV